MMGSGKTSVGRALAALTDRTFGDTDQMLQKRLGQTITRLFQVYGEDAFRQHETSLLRSLEPEEGVLATGGGIVSRDENWTELGRLGTTIFLDVPVEILCQRLERSRHRRPLLQSDDWETKIAELLERRRPMYERADLHFHVHDRTIEDVAEDLVEVIRCNL